ncbi:hypothetical protein IT413_01005 [Candidatus Peregrinibacteria bacterium]|nr:hypothetical protein [Candidatus Peregrinibacteria bacterium]
MADDIIINTGAGTGDQSQPANTGSTQQASTAQTAGNQSVAAPPASIDLAAAVPAQPKPANQGINLEEAAMMETTTMAPPEKFSVPTLVKEKFPDLMQLIKETESMNDEERDYWFQILPIMTEDQIKKFRDILLNEKQQLQRLDKEYENELKSLNEKHLLEWKEFESKEKRKALQAAEQQSKAEEAQLEEELLKRLSS